MGSKFCFLAWSMLCLTIANAAPSSEQDLDFITMELGYVLQNGYVSPDGDRHEIPVSMFAKNLSDFRASLDSFSAEDLRALRKLSYRSDGRLAYFMVKMTDQPNELRLGYRTAYVGQQRVSELAEFLLLDTTHHRVLGEQEKIALKVKTGLGLEQQANWQDNGAFRKIIQHVYRSYLGLEPPQQRCLRNAKMRIIVEELRFSSEFMINPTELRFNYDNSVTVSRDRIADLVPFLVSHCS